MNTEVKIFFAEVPEVVDEVALQEALEGLPGWRLEKALAFRRPLDRYLCARAWKLLKTALGEVYGIRELPPFGYLQAGKPYLEGLPDVHFNLSHCPSCVCCAVADRPVGVDVEDLQFEEALAVEVCSPEELSLIRSGGKPEVEFTRLWTMKESLLKMTGEGIRNNMKGVLAPPCPEFSTLVPEGGKYVISCIAAGEKNIYRYEGLYSTL